MVMTTNLRDDTNTQRLLTAGLCCGGANNPQASSAALDDEVKLASFRKISARKLQTPHALADAVRTTDHSTNISVQPSAAFAVTLQESSDGPVLLHKLYDGGASLTLTLDRILHYHAAASTVSASTYTCAMPAGLPLRHHDCHAIPRALLSFNIHLKAGRISRRNVEAMPSEEVRTNFEFLAFTFRFISQKPPWQYGSRANAADARSTASKSPFVRGFVATDLAGSGFLQTFGPSLYAGLREAELSTKVLVLGSSAENCDYRSFEWGLSRLHKPVDYAADKIAARSASDRSPKEPSSPLQPARVTDQSTGALHPGENPSLSSSVDTPAYGTSGIRVMIKREVFDEASWQPSCIPFTIMLEVPPMASCVMADIELDASVIKQSKVIPPFAFPPRSSHRHTHSDPSQLSSRITREASRLTGIFSRRRNASLELDPTAGENWRTTAPRALNPSGQNHSVCIYPRLSPISAVVTAGGSVQDLLYSHSSSTGRPLSQSGLPVMTKSVNSQIATNGGHGRLSSRRALYQQSAEIETRRDMVVASASAAGEISFVRKPTFVAAPVSPQTSPPALRPQPFSSPARKPTYMVCADILFETVGRASSTDSRYPCHTLPSAAPRHREDSLHTRATQVADEVRYTDSTTAGSTNFVREHLGIAETEDNVYNAPRADLLLRQLSTSSAASLHLQDKQTDDGYSSDSDFSVSVRNMVHLRLNTIITG